MTPIMEPDKIHIPCVILVDTSNSMKGNETQIVDAITQIIESAKMDDFISSNRVLEICLLFFNTVVHIENPFIPVNEIHIPANISCGGKTNIYEAINFALHLVQYRREEYFFHQISYFNYPHIWLLSDGWSESEDNGTTERLIKAQKQTSRGIEFHVVAIGNNPNETKLSKMQISNRVLRHGRDDIARAWNPDAHWDGFLGDEDDSLLPDPEKEVVLPASYTGECLWCEIDPLGE